MMRENYDTSLTDKIRDGGSEAKIAVLTAIYQTEDSADAKKLEEALVKMGSGDLTYSASGLVNDNDVYDFYVKHEDEINGFLDEGGFLESSPADIGASTVYEYLLAATREAIRLMAAEMAMELFGIKVEKAEDTGDEEVQILDPEEKDGTDYTF